MSWEIIVILIISGLLVGFINTLAGSGTIISISVLIFLGLPPTVANGTNRVAVFFQNIVAVRGFNKHKQLDAKKGLWFALPAVIGAILGAFIAVEVNEKIMERAIGIIMVIMLFFLIFKPNRWLIGSEHKMQKKVSSAQIVYYFLIGVYGGFIHIGVGIFLLALTVVNAGYDLVKANGIKNFIVFLYNPFALLVFIIGGMVNFKYGLIHAIGNMIGAYIAAKWAVSWGTNFVRWMLIVIIVFASGKFLGIFNPLDYLHH